MKTSRVITLVLVVVITLLCSFPVFAMGAYTYSKTNQDVYGAINYYYSVNAVGADTSIVADPDSPDPTYTDAQAGTYYIDYTFNVQVVNSSEFYQVAEYNTDRYVFTIDVNTGSASFFSGFNWDYLNSVVSYSDNMTAPVINVDDSTGHITFSWYDSSGQFVLAPSETKTYSFIIRSTTSYGSGINYDYTPYSAEDMTYFPSGSSFSLSKKPTSFTSSSFLDFSSYSSVLYSAPSHTRTFLTGVEFFSRAFNYQPVLVDLDLLDTSVNTYGYDVVYRVPVYLHIMAYNNTSDDYYYSEPYIYTVLDKNFTDDVYDFIGMTFESDYPNHITEDAAHLIMEYYPSSDFIVPDPSYNASLYLPSCSIVHNVIQFYLYFGCVSNNGDFSPLTIDQTYLKPYIPNYGSFNIYDNELVDTTDNVHQQEESYFNSTDTAISDTGISSYQFNSNQSGGISGVSDDFVRVWNALGPLNSVVIFSLTLNLALFILRHRRRI